MTTDIGEEARSFIGGRWVPARGDRTHRVVNPTNGETLALLASASVEDVDDAVAAARDAADDWAQTSTDVRQEHLRRIERTLTERRAELADLITREVGTPRSQSDARQVGLPIRSFATTAQALEEFEFEEQVGSSRVLREPMGVAAAITPWNFPLNQVAAKVAPALAAGCTIVVKPSEVKPLSVLAFADLIEEVGLPAGVFNLVLGDGPVVGEALVCDPRIDVVSFTGSTRAGRRIGQLAAETVKRVALELGGKSPAVLLDDADFETAVPAVLNSCFSNSGQACVALTRMLVPAGRLAEAEELAADAAAKLVVGDPLDPDTDVGPLVSAEQRDRVLRYLHIAELEGARLVAGGPERPASAPVKGFFVRPTVYSDVTTEMTLAQEEVFGPVLSIMAYEDEDDAVAVANDTVYGLAAGVWSSDQAHGELVSRRINSGQVWVNGTRSPEVLPFGGYKQSGNGREWGRWGIDEYLETKALHLSPASSEAG